MAETDATQQSETVQLQDQAQNLKYLEFVQVATVHAIVLLLRVYSFAKENSGPLKAGVQRVEGTVKTVADPVYVKFHDFPFQLLKFADRKVDGLVHGIDRHVPKVVKEASSQALSATNKVSDAARSMSSKVQREGVANTAVALARGAYTTRVQPAVKDLCAHYEPVAERCAVSAWHSLNRIPIVPEVVVPAAANWSEKYNRGVMYITEKGYRVSAYMPLVPTRSIAKVFGGLSPSSAAVVAS